MKDGFENCKLLVLDGNSIINRAYFGLAGRQQLSAADGTPTGAVFAFFNMLFSYMDKVKPERVAVCFDRPEATFRHQLYAGYKAGRAAMPDELALQLPLVKEGLRLMGYAVLEKSGHEADDLIAALCAYSEEKGERVCVLSGDRDLWQLISENVSLIFPYTNKSGSSREWMNPEAFRNIYGFAPGQLLDLKALMGDSSDNIPGVKGVGEKTGLALIREFGSLDQVYAHLEDIKGAVRKRLEEGKESAYLSYRLAALNAAWPFAVSAGEVTAAETPDKAGLELYFQRLGMRKFAERFSLSPPPEKTAAKTSFRETDKLDELSEEGRLSLVPLKEGALLMDEKGSYFKLRGENEKAVLLELGRKKRRLIIFSSKDYLKRLLPELEEQIFFDCEIAAYLLNQHLSGADRDHDFRRVYQMNLGENFPLGAQLAAAEAAALFKIEEKQRSLLKENQMEDLAYELEFPLARVLAQMEMQGILLDMKQLELLSAEMAKEQRALEERIYADLGAEINLNSTYQLSEKLFGTLGLKGGKKLKDGSYSTAADELERLRDEHPVIPLILEHRELAKLRSTFVEGLRREIAEDGRIHTTFKQTQTSTGRLSSAAPNLQNIPIRSERASGIRRLFVAAPGYSLVDADYSQIELRLLAVLSEDQALSEAFRSGHDIHRATAARILGIPEEAVDAKERRAAKTVNFSIVYGVSDFGLARNLAVSVPEARAYIQSYEAHYPRVRPWLRAQVDFAKKNAYVLTMLGRRRYIPELKSANYQQRQFGERAAMNAPVQGSAADLIKLAMLRIERSLREEGMRTKLLLQVHDELLLEAPDEEKEKAAQLLRQAMEEAMQLSLELKVEVETGKNWAEVK